MSRVQSLLPVKKKINSFRAHRQVNVLRNELAPHFIVNALGRLSIMIERNTGEAIAFTEKLAAVYRDILEMSNCDLVPLAKELELLKNYANLVKTGLEGSINIQVEAAPNRDIFIVPVSLQVLMENAVKHNYFSCEQPLRINISWDDKCIRFNNRLQPKKYPSFSGKRGLRNLDARCSMIIGRPIKIEQSNTDFMIKLPLIQKRYA